MAELESVWSGLQVPMLSEKELREHFNMPLNEVAKKFGMCTTALKKLCRKYGVMQVSYHTAPPSCKAVLLLFLLGCIIIVPPHDMHIASKDLPDPTLKGPRGSTQIT
eukprot:2915377-Rhodomonas_salina.2